MAYYTPPEFTLELLGMGDRVIDPPDGRIPFYEETPKVGLWLPFHPFLVKLMGVLPLGLVFIDTELMVNHNKVSLSMPPPKHPSLGFSFSSVLHLEAPLHQGAKILVVSIVEP